MKFRGRNEPKKCQRVCKPGSVLLHSLGDGGCATIPLGDGSLRPSSNQPGRRAGTRPMCRPYSVLLPVGFALRTPLPGSRCALTAPFHCHRTEAFATCFLLHFPWGHPRRALPGTAVPWSPDFPLPRRSEAAAARPSGSSYLASPRSRSKSRLKRIARHSPQISPSICSGRKRRWKAVTAALASRTS